MYVHLSSFHRRERNALLQLLCAVMCAYGEGGLTDQITKSITALVREASVNKGSKSVICRNLATYRPNYGSNYGSNYAQITANYH